MTESDKEIILNSSDAGDDIQKSIVDIYKTYNTRKSINERLKTQIKDICPILIKGSIEEAMEVENVHTAV